MHTMWQTNNHVANQQSKPSMWQCGMQYVQCAIQIVHCAASLPTRSHVKRQTNSSFLSQPSSTKLALSPTLSCVKVITFCASPTHLFSHSQCHLCPCKVQPRSQNYLGFDQASFKKCYQLVSCVSVSDSFSDLPRETNRNSQVFCPACKVGIFTCLAVKNTQEHSPFSYIVFHPTCKVGVFCCEKHTGTLASGVSPI